MSHSLKRFLRALPTLLLTPFALFLSLAALVLTDLLWLLAGRRHKPIVSNNDTAPNLRAASLVIPNWNGKDLLIRFLPTWLEAIRHHPGSEVLIVDNGSTDGSAEWIRANHPEVHLLALPENLGFGGGSNAGFRAAKNDIVVLLNSDMRVEPDFLQPLLDGFGSDSGIADPTIFAVSCQIFLGDKSKRREETGLTQGWWADGRLRVSHREDEDVDRLFPCFYGGGGSCAFHRNKFLSLGGFDDLLAPFYLEDTDIGYLAWKRGWKVYYQPTSIVHHEHRGTIGKKFTRDFIDSVLQKNFLVFCWKNIHAWPRLASHFLFAQAGAIMSAWAGNEPTRASIPGILRAFTHLPRAVASRWRAKSLAQISDAEVFRVSTPAYFHDRFSQFEVRPARPRVLFFSPYPVCPPTHGGGVFMYNTIRQLAHRCDVHAIVMLDYADQHWPNQELRQYCKSVSFYVRLADDDLHLASIRPHAIDEFFSEKVEWIFEREILKHKIDLIQLDYTSLGQYARPFRNIPSALFEHDVYFQSIGRALPFMKSGMERVKARFEYLRSIRYELNLLPRCDHIQVCTEENRLYLESFRPSIALKLHAGMRACIDTTQYPYPGGPRSPYTMLFLGSFKHTPNLVALEWFTREVLPLILEKLPHARLVVAGSDPPPRHAFPINSAVDLLGFVEDIQPLFNSAAVFICPIRNGSGVRVKLLETFASGVPVVSTRLGAEGLARRDGEFCLLSDDPAGFAEKTICLLENPAYAAKLAASARREVETNWDAAVVTNRLVDSYRELLLAKRSR